MQAAVCGRAFEDPFDTHFLHPRIWPSDAEIGAARSDDKRGATFGGYSRLTQNGEHRCKVS